MKKTMPAYLNSLDSRSNILETMGEEYIVFRKFYKLLSDYSEKFDSIEYINHSKEELEISIHLYHKDDNLIEHIKEHLNDGVEYDIDGLTIFLKIKK